jgi:hypothetical protein
MFKRFSVDLFDYSCRASTVLAQGQFAIQQKTLNGKESLTGGVV